MLTAHQRQRDAGIGRSCNYRRNHMSKITSIAGKTLTATVHLAVFAGHLRDGFSTENLLSVFSFEPSKHDPDWVALGTREISYTLADDFDPVAPMVASLEAKKAELTAEFTAKVMELNKQLSELQAIEHSA
jgi:hypothetical protein